MRVSSLWFSFHVWTRDGRDQKETNDKKPITQAETSNQKKKR